MNYIGISNGFHDAGISVISDSGNILFAGHSERYSKQKHDKELHISLVADALRYIDDSNIELHYYERPLFKILRQIRAGESPAFKNLSDKSLLGTDVYEKLCKKKVTKHNHHLSHAAAGFQSSPYEDATVVVIDAIGEFETITIWDAMYDINEIGRAHV